MRYGVCSGHQSCHSAYRFHAPVRTPRLTVLRTVLAIVLAIIALAVAATLVWVPAIHADATSTTFSQTVVIIPAEGGIANVQ